MEKKKRPEQIPGAELDVMRSLWEIGEPTSVAEIHRVMQKYRRCSQPAVHILTDRLAGKDFVLIEQIERPVPYKRITPLVSEAEYAAAEATGLVEKLFHGSWSRLVVSLADRGEITEEDILEIGRFLKDREGPKK